MGFVYRHAMDADAVVIVLSTMPPDERGAAIARALVEEALAACVNLVPGVRSIYRWDGALCDEPEQLAIIKTTRPRVESLVARLCELHPYQVPEGVVVATAGGHHPYLAWVADSVAR